MNNNGDQQYSNPGDPAVRYTAAQGQSIPATQIPVQNQQTPAQFVQGQPVQYVQVPVQQYVQAPAQEKGIPMAGAAKRPRGLMVRRLMLKILLGLVILILLFYLYLLLTA